MTTRGREGGFQQGNEIDLDELRPSWALAYILEDWKRTRAVRKAYDETCAHGASDEHAQKLLAEALRKLRVYVAALEEVSR